MRWTFAPGEADRAVDPTTCFKSVDPAGDRVPKLLHPTRGGAHRGWVIALELGDVVGDRERRVLDQIW